MSHALWTSLNTCYTIINRLPHATPNDKTLCTCTLLRTQRLTLTSFWYLKGQASVCYLPNVETAACVTTTQDVGIVLTGFHWDQVSEGFSGP